MVIRRDGGTISHCRFRELPELLRRGDCLVLNDSRVVPARLVGHRADTGGRWEGLFLAADNAARWELLSQTRGKLQPGERVAVEAPSGAQSGGVIEPLMLRMHEATTQGTWIAQAESPLTWPELLNRYGRVPLPPYIRRGIEAPGDRERYQTVFARAPGSVAAPTAGLHFTEPLLAALRDAGVEVVTVTLHVGVGTFRPITTDRVEEHEMHAEWGSVPQEVADAVCECRTRGGRMVAVGSTTVRLLETAARQARVSGKRNEADVEEPCFGSWDGSTDLYIYPPFEFRVVDALVTNFHLPRSSLLVMVSAFAGGELIRQAYDEAIRQRYRFYSYGDAMLLL
jgi:S-adenosylmethionine:tRNA ribosyltransferase-isomerase